MARKDNPDYDIRLPEWNAEDPWFDLSGDENKTRRRALRGGRPWRVAPEDKKQPVHGKASTCDSLVNIYPNAIAVGTASGAIDEKISLIILLVIGLIAFPVIGSFSLSPILEYVNHHDYIVDDIYTVRSIGALDIIMSLIFGFFSIFFLMISIYVSKLIFLAPSDLPVIFNKKTREVTFLRPIPLRFWKFWQLVKFDGVHTFRWEDVRARSYKLTEFTGSAGRESTLLVLMWPQEADPHRCEIFINIGYKGWWEDELLWRLYEHIRRYMEEDGPPIQPGETLRTSGFGKLPEFPFEVIAKAGGPALSPEEVMKLAFQAV